MTSPVKLNLTIIQGSTFRQVFRWESNIKVYVPITNISKSAPMVITVPTHEIPEGWRIKVTNVGGMKEINSNDIYHTVTTVTNNTLTINNINSLSYSTYTSGGVVEYNKPIDISYFTARMQIRSKIASDTIIYNLTSENGNIELNTEFSTITLILQDEITKDFNFNSAVYDLELISDAGEVIRLAGGTILVEKEVTR